jgi:hypothetical protein
MFRYSLAVFGLAAWLLAGVAWAQSDDFDDGVMAPQWSLVQDNPGELSVVEQNGRLEALATPSGSPTDDALYLSNGPGGFKLDTDADFSMSIDYSFTGYDGSSSSLLDAIGLVFGLGRDLEGTDAAAVGFGVVNSGAGFVSALTEAHRIDDVETANILRIGGPATGTFTISYDAAGDDLTLGDETASFTLEDTVRGIWGADDLYVSFGARGSGYTLVSGDAFLDNFVVVPEPATLALLLSALLAAALARRVGALHPRA